MEKVLVIVVTYNGMAWIDRCLSSLFDTDFSVDVFVSDNLSTDDTVKHIKSNYPQVILSENKKNLGFGGANNIGFNYAIRQGYDYVYLLNQDAWVFDHTIETLINVSVSHPEYAILSPLQCTASLKALDDDFYHNVPESLWRDVFFDSKKEVYETDFLMAAHWFIPVSSLKTIGAFSPAFFHYGEDDNYVNRAHWHGYKIGIVPALKVVHDREYRIDSKKKILYMKSTFAIVRVSNPNVKWYLMIPRIMGSFCYNALKYRSFVSILNAVQFMIRLPHYLKIKKLSVVKKAFLTDI